jgi:hypothetical protein
MGPFGRHFLQGVLLRYPGAAEMLDEELTESVAS